MSEHENAPDEDLICNCGGSMRSAAGAGWTCTECGEHASISGRISVRKPDLHDFRTSGVRAYINRVGATPEDGGWRDLGALEDVTIKYNHPEAEKALIDAWWALTGTFGQVDVSGDDERDD